MNVECPLTTNTGTVVRLGHGSGGVMSQQLLRECVFPHFDNAWTKQEHDGARIPMPKGQVVFTTDSFVITPLFFPGGDIGKLAVYGTVNDLAMCGARPEYLSCSLILEEGLPFATLDRVIESMARAASETGVQFVTGDTKVVERGKGDGLYINTAGIGTMACPDAIEPRQIRPGDRIILSGDIGRHGVAVMAKREGLCFDSPLQSDCAPLHGAVRSLLDAGITPHCLRDLTRGGLATALVELAETARKEILVHEADIPVGDAVQGACEMLGLDPLYVANEGRFIAFIRPEEVDRALSILSRDPVGSGSRIIGKVGEGDCHQVILRNSLGCERLLYRLPGEQLPRIC
ncbi:hydrogenase expression/formation protein HypE [Microbulbifer sediminum]|uniref:hydrogenase expression/formation protein HypE n=1 Tax=Microbulbifer sediminum TaxID=2904250 RepID=UPI001F238265|nr:hydrogenase expression/formation protein HypE [Microbulbifer sediminum]